MTEMTRLEADDDGASLTFYTGELAVDEAAVEAGYTPNGVFWEGVAAFGFPDLAEDLEFDSEAGMFAAYGEREKLAELQRGLEEYLTDADALLDLVQRAEGEGVDLEDGA